MEPAKTHVRFALDPLAEYLAALHLIEAPSALREFVESLAAGSQDANGFRAALLDCLQAKPSDDPLLAEALANLRGPVPPHEVHN